MRKWSVWVVMITFWIPSFGQAGTGENIEIKWLLAHEPARVFRRAAAIFADHVHKKSDGRVSVTVMTISEYAKLGMTVDQVVDEVKENKVQMTQVYTTYLGYMHADMRVLDLPFLFTDHDHASRVLDGATGKKILSGLAANGMHGLSFTYSGGFRVIATRSKEIKSVDDFKGLKVRTANSPVARDVFLRLGAEPAPGELKEGFVKIANGEISAGETTYARYEEPQQKVAPVLNDTGHSLFLTALVVNERFFKSLAPDIQKIIQDAALEAAILERKTAVEDGLQIKRSLGKRGLKLVELPAAEKAKMKKLLQPVYKTLTEQYSLIKEIQNQ